MVSRRVTNEGKANTISTNLDGLIKHVAGTDAGVLGLKVG